ncbi:MAG: hypothetical protein ACF8OB_15420 [Phycisphaeraceae bacterium JB051]
MSEAESKIWTISDVKMHLDAILDLVDDMSPQIVSDMGRTFVLLPIDQYKDMFRLKYGFLDYIINHGPQIEHFEPMPRY